MTIAAIALSGSSEKQVSLHLGDSINNGGSSIFDGRRGRQREQVANLTLSQFVERYSVDRCDLMKVDIEGAEYGLLMNQESERVLRSGIFKNIALEIHNSILRARGLSGQDLYERLLNCGYILDSELGPWVFRFAPRKQ